MILEKSFYLAFFNSNFINNEFFFLYYSYFKHKIKAKSAITWKDLPPFFSTWLDYSSTKCMYTMKKLYTYTTALLSGKKWYIDCPISFIHPLEVQFRNFLEGIDAIDI